MLILLIAAAISTESSTGLENLPADPTLARWVIAVTGLIALSPMIVARLQAKKATNDAKTGGTSIVIGSSVTPHIDASQALLATMVSKLESRVDAADARYLELEKRHYELMREYAKASAEVESLRDQVGILHGRLMGHG